MYEQTHEQTQETTPPRVGIILTEVELTKPLHRRLLSRIRTHQRHWWNEERLVLLAIGLGNACLFSLVLWWIW
jgi:hypothetical protein